MSVWLFFCLVSFCCLYRPGKRLWVDDHKWEHDRFDARQQAPKSAQDLIEAYGFDIRRGAESDIPVRDSMPR